jgi:hypothetical protein
MTKKKCFPIHLPSIHNAAWVTFGSLFVIIHPSIYPSIHRSGHGVLVAVGSFWPCQWYIVLWPGGPSQQQHGQNPEKKKVGWFERFSLRYCGQQKKEFRAGMKIFISSSKANNKTSKQSF